MLRDKERDGYVAVQFGCRVGEGEECRSKAARRSPMAKAECRAQARSSSNPRLADDATLDVGAELVGRPFRRRPDRRHPGRHAGQGLCRRGARWGPFGGMRASHGVSISHRAHGSTGNRQDPGRVSRTRRWPATWARCNRHSAEFGNRPHLTRRACAASSSSRARSRARRAAGCSSATAAGLPLPTPEAPYLPAGVKSAANSNNAPAETPADAAVEAPAADGAQGS